MRVDRPLEVAQRGVEAALNRRQRDVHDRVVEHDHEQREAHGSERPPLAVVLGEPEAFWHYAVSLIFGAVSLFFDTVAWFSVTSSAMSSRSPNTASAAASLLRSREVS